MSIWGPLQQRYETSQPRKILSLDGGGIRGVLTLEILLELETQLRVALNADEKFVLADYFDYIGGTSTGAIIAAGLSLGKSAQEMLDFYQQKGEAMFDKAFLLKRVKYFYNDGPLLQELKVCLQHNDTRAEQWVIELEKQTAGQLPHWLTRLANAVRALEYDAALGLLPQER